MRKLRKLRYVPLAFVVGVEGFAMVAPYLILFMGVVMVVRNYQARTALLAAAVG